MAVTKRLRYEILRRDNHACRYCGLVAPATELTVDHVIPVALGGSDQPDNLVACCKDCNAGKSASSPDSPLVEDVKQDALRWARTMRSIAAAAAKERAGRMENYRAVDDEWKNWHWSDGNELSRPVDWMDSVDRFLDAGLTIGDIEAAIVSSMTRTTVGADAKWRYTCGVLWTELKQRNEVAQELLSRPEWLAKME